MNIFMNQSKAHKLNHEFRVVDSNIRCTDLRKGRSKNRSKGT